jgi:hypothetical protein
VGFQALGSNTTGIEQVAIGHGASSSIISLGFSVAVGFQALLNATGGQNTAVGDNALGNVSTGTLNTALGDLAGVGLTTGVGNVYIGGFVNAGSAAETNTTRIKNIYSTVQPVVGTNPDYVTVNSSGRLGRGNVSSRRYKHDIKLMDKASEALFALKPVTFRYKQEFDETQTLAYGLIAEEVDKVYPNLVGRNAEGQPESVRYEQINAMLLNEFLKEHGKVQGLESEVKALSAALKEQAAQIQKVSAQLELQRSTPQVVANH